MIENKNIDVGFRFSSVSNSFVERVACFE